ncbi:MAG TPA: CopG family transcriptional regulator [Acidimicrobiia bacterium]|nr:CopG family transcriptional regulator [Acidimicrobiia bacterium]
MVKTTVYLPKALKEALARMAGREGRSEAELVRLAVERLVESEGHPRPVASIPVGRP